MIGNHQCPGHAPGHCHVRRLSPAWYSQPTAIRPAASDQSTL